MRGLVNRFRLVWLKTKGVIGFGLMVVIGSVLIIISGLVVIIGSGLIVVIGSVLVMRFRCNSKGSRVIWGRKGTIVMRNLTLNSRFMTE